jgi:TPR repeat protein
VPKNYDLAAGWYAAAAVQGVARAQFELAGLYAEGKGVETSAEESVRWYIAAARQGHKMSKELLKSFKVEY